MNDCLKNYRCVILAVHPCNVDFHNSQIYREARQVTKDTKRTFPVLTQPVSSIVEQKAVLAASWRKNRGVQDGILHDQRT
jgi:hypothetical protein